LQNSNLERALKEVSVIQYHLLLNVREISLNDPKVAAAMFGLSLDSAIKLSKTPLSKLSLLQKIQAPLFSFKGIGAKKDSFNDVVSALNSGSLQRLELASTSSMFE
jgi:hypothetical protein